MANGTDAATFEVTEPSMITPARVSYAVLAATIILAGLLHLGVPLLVVLFSYFALRQLYSLTRRKWLALDLVHHRCGRDCHCRSFFYSCGHFGVAGCGGYLHSFGQRMGAEAPDRLALY